MSPRMRDTYIVVACFVAASWLLGKISFQGILFWLGFGAVLLFAKHFPKIGTAIGILLMSAPLGAWWIGRDIPFNILMLLVWGVSLCIAFIGYSIISAAHDQTEYSEEEKIEMIRNALGGNERE